MSKTVNDYPTLSKLLLVACEFDKEKSSKLLESLVNEANTGNLELEDSDNLNDIRWSRTKEGGDFWCSLDDKLEELYPEDYSFPCGFNAGALDNIINERKE